jgi:hypothetical protein
MAKKKTYYIPTIEIVSMEPGWPVLIADSNGHGAGGYSGHGAPKRFTPAF